MPELADFPFHFLRPYWLLAAVPVVAIVILVTRREHAERQWSGLIAPHLLRHLIVRPDRKWRIHPVYLVAACMILAVIAVAGPTWRRELPPFFEDKAPLMIALALGSSMNQQDVPPSRLERAKQKIRDLLGARSGARTGLIAYAGTAHLVMPLTDDRAVIEPFLAALAPALMPEDGKNVAAGVSLAADALANEEIAGSILVITDDLSGTDAAALQAAAGRNSLVFLKMVPQPGLSGFGDSVNVSVDASDIQSLERRIETHYIAAQTAEFGTRWRDDGYWLLIPVALLTLLWFRRGTTVQWCILLALCCLLQPAPASAAGSSWFRDLWLTPDQQGRLAFDRGNYRKAMSLFADPMWRGLAAYRAYDFHAAAEAFKAVETQEGRFALGNALARNHEFENAIAAYDTLLKADPGNAAAKKNREIVLAALRRQEEQRKKQEQSETPPDLPPDDTKIDPEQKGGKRVKVSPQDLTTPGAAEAWMREVQTSPADFLKLKFAIQAATSEPEKRAE